MQDCSPAKTPMGSGHYKDLASASDADKAPLSREDHETYRAILGSVNFLTMCTRPDLAFAISVLSSSASRRSKRARHRPVFSCLALLERANPFRRHNPRTLSLS
eukprot:jgi/Tetstr1/462571/TSEL_007557.t1